jgi:neutral trehalase
MVRNQFLFFTFKYNSICGVGSVYWRNVRTGAETGWDFSSRWIGAPHHEVSGIVATGNLHTILSSVDTNLMYILYYFD